MHDETRTQTVVDTPEALAAGVPNCGTNNPTPATQPQAVLNLSRETERIRHVYARRTQVEILAHGTPLDPFELCAIHEREELLARILRSNGLTTLAGLRILDIGCGTGNLLRHLLDFRADPENCCGIDMLGDRLRIAKRSAPNIGYMMATGAQLPFPDDTFDLILQFTVFTSVLSPEVRLAIANEIVRVLRPTGRFIWYDFAYNNRRNSNVRGIPRRELRNLFPGCRLEFWPVTLAPPIGRPAARIHPLLYRALSEVRFLCSHYMCLVEKV